MEMTIFLFRAQFDAVDKGHAWCGTLNRKILNLDPPELKPLEAAHGILGKASYI
jgi:hypothetical protein